MIYINTKEQRYKNNYCAETVQFYLKNKVFHQGPVFSKALLQKAIDLCQEYESKKIECLLVEHDWGLIVWIEKYTEKKIDRTKTAETIEIAETPTEQVAIANNTTTENIKNTIKKDNNNINKPIIACIDDSRTVQLKVKSTLERAGYRILNILDPSTSMIKLVRQKPALILMDIDMPQYTGYELCKALRRSRKLQDVPVVMLTGRSGAIDKIRSKMAGAVKYMTKPFEATELMDIVEDLAPLEYRKTIEI